MNGKSAITAVLVLALIGATAGVLLHAKEGQQLGAPGVKTRPLAGSKNLEVILPEQMCIRDRAAIVPDELMMWPHIHEWTPNQLESTLKLSLIHI